jgi:membrane protein DedA with SNARE-associated domain
LLERLPFTRHHAARLLPPAEKFFVRHGPKAVFIGRFIALLRVTAAWLAGITHMEWRKFLFWNATGGIAWATGVSLLSYWAGKAVAESINRYGLYAVIVLVVLGIAVLFGVRSWNKRLERDLES